MPPVVHFRWFRLRRLSQECLGESQEVCGSIRLKCKRTSDARRVDREPYAGPSANHTARQSMAIPRANRARSRPHQWPPGATASLRRVRRSAHRAGSVRRSRREQRIHLSPTKKNARGCVRSNRAAQQRCAFRGTRGRNEAVRTGAVGGRLTRSLDPDWSTRGALPKGPALHDKGICHG